MKMDQNLYNVYSALNNLNDTLRQMHGTLETNNVLLAEQNETKKNTEMLTTFVGRLNGTMMRVEELLKANNSLLEKQNEHLELMNQEIGIEVDRSQKLSDFFEEREKKGI
jgi:hypothetical protein